MTVPRKAKAPGGPGAEAAQIQDIDNPILYDNGKVVNPPILLLDINLALDAVLDQEALHVAAARSFYAQWHKLFDEASRFGSLALAHAKAAQTARRERAILKRGVSL